MAGVEHKRVCYLMSVYNDPQGMMRTLSSVFEDEALADIIIIDDGSLVPLSLPIAPPGISLQIIRKDMNSGLVNALNTGLRSILAGGYSYVARIDAGDSVHKGRLRAQLEYMEGHPRTGVLGTQMNAVDPLNNRILFAIRNPCDAKTAARLLRVRNVLAHPSVMIRTDALRDCGLYDPRFPCAEDYELWRRIARRYEVANLPAPYVNKEITPKQITALQRRRSILSRLRAQLMYFEPFHAYAWHGIARSLFSLLLSRRALLILRQTHSKWQTA